MDNMHDISDKIVDNLYTELKELLGKTQSYFQNEGKLIRGQLSMEDKLVFTINMGAIISMQTSSLAWILAYKAYKAGEFTEEKLISEFDIIDVPEVMHNNIGSLQPILTKTVGVTNLVKRHIHNMKGV